MSYKRPLRCRWYRTTSRMAGRRAPDLKGDALPSLDEIFGTLPRREEKRRAVERRRTFSSSSDEELPPSVADVFARRAPPPPRSVAAPSKPPPAEEEELPPSVADVFARREPKRPDPPPIYIVLNDDYEDEAVVARAAFEVGGASSGFWHASAIRPERYKVDAARCLMRRAPPEEHETAPANIAHLFEPVQTRGNSDSSDMFSARGFAALQALRDSARYIGKVDWGGERPVALTPSAGEDVWRLVGVAAGHAQVERQSRLLNWELLTKGRIYAGAFRIEDEQKQRGMPLRDLRDAKRVVRETAIEEQATVKAAHALRLLRELYNERFAEGRTPGSLDLPDQVMVFFEAAYTLALLVPLPQPESSEDEFAD
jgi:hypothetical protein